MKVWNFCAKTLRVAIFGKFHDEWNGTKNDINNKFTLALLSRIFFLFFPG